MKKPYILLTTSNISSSSLESLTGDIQIIYSDKVTSHVIIKAGGIPLYLPSITTITYKEMKEYIKICDGVCLTGAATGVNPIHYGESPTVLSDRIDDERDQIDILLVKEAIKRKIPLFGICKGAQIINVALGGTLYQNLEKQKRGEMRHEIRKTDRSNITHRLKLKTDSILYSIFKNEIIHVNSSHSQAVKKLSSLLRPTAVADDGVIEGFEAKSNQFILGVQFHPELRYFDRPFAQIFERFIRACISH